MKRSAIVKIDLCGSKDYVETHKGYEGNLRENLLNELVEFAKGIYPDSEKAYPDGSLYSAQGDCIYLVLDRPTVAVRCTIEFMKGWCGKVPSLPDCRSVIDYGEIEESKKIGRLELLGEPFENISKMEKEFDAGQIGVTESIIEKSDNTLVQYIRLIRIDVTSIRTISTYLVNYENPRLINDSSLAHALFIADPSSTQIRNRAFEALLIEALTESGQDDLPLDDFFNWLRLRNLPEPSAPQLEYVVKNSKFIKIGTNGSSISWIQDVKIKIQELQNQFSLEQQKAINFITSEISQRLNIQGDLLEEKLNISKMTEEYLCAVFLQIRMMANYFRSTGSLFERLSAHKDFDYIISKHFKAICPDRQEELLLFKRTFLEALTKLSMQKDTYIASIFHNVLLLYYLNRNSSLSRGQIAKLKDKAIYLDANTFYAYICEISTFHDILHFTLGKLQKLGSKLYLYDRSLEEYSKSLDYTIRKYQQKSHYEFIDGGPWIWKEFLSNITRYRNDFEYCIALHSFPKTQEKGSDTFDAAKAELNKIGINLVLMEPFYSESELGELYSAVYNSKKKFDRTTQWWYVPKGSTEQYENIVLHDANCLRHLEHSVSNPLSATKLFVTCDFRLAKIRKKIPFKYEFMMTVPEFYEFMLPYLFMANEMVTQPVEMPNFLLASLVHRDLLETIDFKDLLGDYLANNIDKIGDFKVLEELSMKKRYKDIRKKYENLAESPPDKLEEEMKAFLHESTELLSEYSNKVKESLTKSILADKFESQKREIEELKKELGETKLKLVIQEKKEIKRKRYQKKQERRKKSKKK